MKGLGAHADLRERFGETEPVDDARGVGADLDAGADLAEAFRLLVDLNVMAGLEQVERRRRAANAAADDGDFEFLGWSVAGHCLPPSAVALTAT